MRKLAVLTLVATMGAAAPALGAVDEYDDSQAHPLRVVAYLVHPVGYALEWVVFRPFHWMVAQDGLDEVFGHRPHGAEVGADVPSI